MASRPTFWSVRVPRLCLGGCAWAGPCLSRSGSSERRPRCLRAGDSVDPPSGDPVNTSYRRRKQHYLAEAKRIQTSLCGPPYFPNGEGTNCLLLRSTQYFRETENTDVASTSVTSGPRPFNSPCRPLPAIRDPGGAGAVRPRGGHPGRRTAAETLHARTRVGLAQAPPFTGAGDNEAAP
jgi:hypothetical protein